MIKLKEIVNDNAALQNMKRLGAQGKKAAADLLGKRGLKDPDYFTLKFKRVSNPNWIAQYRSYSIMSGRPIFWMNINLPEVVKDYDPDANIVWILTDNILHEWWHAIMDAFRITQLKGKVKVDLFVSSSSDQKEENQAEEFIQWVVDKNRVNSNADKYFSSVIKEFNKLWSSND